MAFTTNIQSGFDLPEFMVETRAQALFTAQEQSLFLGGSLIPMITVPAGSVAAKVAKYDDGSASAETIGTGGSQEDIGAAAIAPASTLIELNLIAARHVARELGGLNSQEIGTWLGRAVTKKFDQSVIAALDAGLAAVTGAMTVDKMFEVVEQIRTNGEMGQLVAVLSPNAVRLLSNDLSTAPFAAADAQNEALRNGFAGTVAGVRVFQSAYVTGAQGYVMGADAARIAMSRGLDVAMAPRIEAVGMDAVASLIAGAGVVDAARGAKLTLA